MDIQKDKKKMTEDGIKEEPGKENCSTPLKNSPICKKDQAYRFSIRINYLLITSGYITKTLW